MSREAGFYWVKWKDWPEHPEPFIAEYREKYGYPACLITGSEQDSEESEFVFLSGKLAPPSAPLEAP